MYAICLIKKKCCSYKSSKTSIESIESCTDVKNVHRVIQFNQEAWLKSYIEMNTKLRTKAKNDFEKYFLKLMNNSVFRKAIENVRKHRDIKFWYDYIQPKYQNNAKLCYMNPDSIIIHIKTGYVYKDTADDAEKRYDISDYKADRPLPRERNKKVIVLMKDELRGKIITEFVALRPKTFSYLIEDDKNVTKY